MYTPKILYTVELSNEERQEVSHLASNTRGAQKNKNALILFAVDYGEFQTSYNTDERITEILDIDHEGIYRVKRDCMKCSIETVLSDKIEKRLHRTRLLDGKQETHLVTLASNEPSEDHCR